MTFYLPGCLLQKALSIKAPRDLYNLAMKQVSSNQRTQTPWSQKTGLLILDLQDCETLHKTNFDMNGDISQEQVATFKKIMHTVLKQNDVD